MNSAADIARWEQRNQRKLAILAKRLGSLESPCCDPQGVNMLHLAYRDIAFAKLAANDIAGASLALRSSVESQITVQQWAYDGEPRALGYRSPGNFPTLIHACLLDDADLARSLASLVHKNIQADNRGPEDSTYIANLCFLLTLEETSLSDCDLEREPEDIDPMFYGYVPMLLAILRRDNENFRHHLSDAASHWITNTARHFAGHPQSVCFLDAAGIVAMARTLGGLRVENIPSCVPTGLVAR